MFFEEKETGYYCADCGIFFHQPEIRHETHGFSYGPYETVLCCPRCGDPTFVREVPTGDAR